MNAPLPPHEDPDLLSRALASTPECPGLEEIAAAALGGLEAARRAQILLHAESCPACGAELELARCFEREDADDASDIDRVVARLRGEDSRAARGVLAFRREGSKPPAAGARRTALWGRWAVAALVIVGVGLGLRALREARPPELPDPIVTGVVRSAELALLAPVGAVEGVPYELVWSEVPGAARYQVELLDVAGDPIASFDAEPPHLVLGPEERALLRPRASYAWRVVARAVDGAEISRSATTEFEILPVRVR